MNTQKRVLLTIGLVAATCLLFTQYRTTFRKPETTAKTPRLIINTEGLKTILYWTPMFKSVDFYLGLGPKIFENCTYKNCYTTHYKDELPVEDFDAIVFHGVEYYDGRFDRPKTRKSNQVYIFTALESPLNTPAFIRDYNNFYNWTMSYRLDSDVLWTYGYIHNVKTGYQPPSLEDIKKRPKKVAWFVSNCYTHSRRESLYNEIRKYVPVDVYGTCGDLSCPKPDGDECYKKIESEYKFYLSFENSVCEDYVTEKLYNILKRDIVPIVYGGADYTTLAPPKSVINVMDFKSVKDLAIYLRFLDTHPEEYLKYFEWKKNHVIVTKNQETLCNLCKKLNEQSQPKTYSDIYKWWHGQHKDKCSDEFIQRVL